MLEQTKADDSVDTVTRQQTTSDESWVNFQQGQAIYVISKASGPALELTQPAGLFASGKTALQ
jgi:hypothetical protein